MVHLLNGLNCCEELLVLLVQPAPKATPDQPDPQVLALQERPALLVLKEILDRQDQLVLKVFRVT
jgi:hypothetical protein